MKNSRFQSRYFKTTSRIHVAFRLVQQTTTRSFNCLNNKKNTQYGLLSTH
ncbi:UNVERIFIED_CONTAM: hypothetical protein FKN15_008215 [Acipenser sinensis]